MKNRGGKKLADVRRRAVIERLTAQLKERVKRTTSGEVVPLSEQDISRIEKELLTLKERVK